MEYQHAYKKLVNHANLSDLMPEEESLVFNLWQSTRIGKMPELQPLRDDVLTCLDVINRSLNGEEPSTIHTKPHALDKDLVRVITAIIEGCQEYSLIWDKRSLYTEENRRLLRETVWMLLHGWHSVLDGDIDSIVEDTRLTTITKDLT